MKGKRVVITGASRGIGLEAAVALAAKGADLLLVVRDEGRGKAAVEQCKATNGGGSVDLVIADLSSVAEMKKAGDEILAKWDVIDVLVNNAGAIIMERVVTKDGYEATFATNHLAYFVLTEKLLPALEKAKEARIVSVASEFHRQGSIAFDDLMGERSFSGMGAYGQSKLANILFTAELARRLEERGVRHVTANSLHPGAIGSNFMLDNKGVLALLWKLGKPFLKSPKDGAKTTIFLASDPSVARVSGKYFDDCKERKPSRKARDMDAAKRLWTVSEALVARAGA